MLGFSPPCPLSHNEFSKKQAVVLSPSHLSTAAYLNKRAKCEGFEVGIKY